MLVCVACVSVAWSCQFVFAVVGDVVLLALSLLVWCLQLLSLYDVVGVVDAICWSFRWRFMSLLDVCCLLSVYTLLIVVVGVTIDVWCYSVLLLVLFNRAVWCCLVSFVLAGVCGCPLFVVCCLL